MTNFDFILYDRVGQLTALVEVKSRYQTSEKWATELRRNILAHGPTPAAPYLLIVTPETIYLWRGSADSPLRAPDAVIDAGLLFRPYLRSGSSTLSRPLDPQVFELVVQAWLSDLTRATSDETPADVALAATGFLDVVRQGRIEFEAAA